MFGKNEVWEEDGLKGRVIDVGGLLHDPFEWELVIDKFKVQAGNTIFACS